MTRNERQAVKRDIRRRKNTNRHHPDRRSTMDVVQQLVNEADNVCGFVAAAAAVRNHIRTNRQPESNHGLMVGLAMRGHYLITQGCDGRSISEAVMKTLSTEPALVGDEQLMLAV